jgi:predicted nucleic acid-binding protein
VYAATARLSDPHKFRIAEAIVEEENFFVSSHVIGEFYAVVRKAQHEMMPAYDAMEWVRRWTPFCALDVDAALMSAAAFIRERFKIEFWDAALVAAAARLGLKTLYSEDLSHKQKYGSVTVINPFK